MSFFNIFTRNKEINERIRPFRVVHHQNETSVILGAGDFNQHIFNERASDGFEGSGYDWASLADKFLNEKMPGLKEKIKMDPEYGMFSAYSSDKQVIEDFAMAFHSFCKNEEAMRDLLSRTKPG